MSRIYDDHRPHDFDSVVGQDKAIKKIQLINRRGIGGNAFWITGATGTGKTTLALITAGLIASESSIVEIDAGDLTIAKLRDLENDSQIYGMGAKSGRCFIVNESHGLRKDTIRQLLVVLERIPGHVCWIFTTTNDAQESLFDDQIDAHPLLSRCITVQLARRNLAQAFAERAQAIAKIEELENGQSIGDYVKLAQKCKNNMRDMLQQIAAGAMLA